MGVHGTVRLGELCKMGDGVTISHECVWVLWAVGPNPSHVMQLLVAKLPRLRAEALSALRVAEGRMSLCPWAAYPWASLYDKTKG